jgi:hypothetical protein
LACSAFVGEGFQTGLHVGRRMQVHQMPRYSGVRQSPTGVKSWSRIEGGCDDRGVCISAIIPQKALALNGYQQCRCAALRGHNVPWP